MSCPICLDPFKDPVVLPCGHSFCRTTCTKGLVRKGRITCPTCRKVHLAPEGVKGLPKNYALEEVIDESPNSDPLCPDHLDERVNLFCTQCYVPVCVKCCLSRRDRGRDAGHREHQVIPLDQTKDYIQGLLSVAEGYLTSRRREEYNYLEKLIAAEEKLQNEEETNSETTREHPQGFQATGNPRTPLDGRCVHLGGIGDQSQQVTDRLIQYDRLLRRCQEMTTSSGEGGSLWTKLPEFRRLLQSLDHLPDPHPPIMDPPDAPPPIVDPPDPPSPSVDPADSPPPVMAAPGSSPIAVQADSPPPIMDEDSTPPPILYPPNTPPPIMDAYSTPHPILDPPNTPPTIMIPSNTPPPIMDQPNTSPPILYPPDGPPPMDPPISDINHQTTDLSQVVGDVTKCFLPLQGKPCSPKLLPQECAVDQRSVSLNWIYDPSDNIGYFTVYYETAIFTHGLCSNRTSVVVTDFGQNVGHVTLHDLDPETRYKISVTASNEFGESSPTEHLYCRTSATKPELCLL
ncbi:uncharacterized protein LOC124270835 [Haliotis rubra]|uniref:uncharacterized protein LOC124270835 n=1 Tax=Haliotis rubra TaxID=36100 RepID=UPI001EE61FD0|nr:uncharacterized protein LOC124270835 [Haliotis rubra]